MPPGEGIHFHVFGVAIMDLLATILGAYFITWKTGLGLPLVLTILFIIGIVIHRMLGIHTTFDKIIFGDDQATLDT